jgi:hypothetical protein
MTQALGCCDATAVAFALASRATNALADSPGTAVSSTSGATQEKARASLSSSSFR